MDVRPSAWLAGPDEAEVVARLLVGFRDHYGRAWPSENSILASVERLIERRDTEYLLGAPGPDAPPAGVVQLRFRHSVWMAVEDCWLEDLYVESGTRRTGLGLALVELALDRARERGCRRVELDTSETNEAALALYRRAGFSESSKSDPPARDLFLGVRLDSPPR
jgi:ribosomal protein S18 acetylase RimI-like enzyme